MLKHYQTAATMHSGPPKRLKKSVELCQIPNNTTKKII